MSKAGRKENVRFRIQVSCNTDKATNVRTACQRSSPTSGLTSRVAGSYTSAFEQPNGNGGRASCGDPVLRPSVAWSARDHGLSRAKAGLPYFHRRMPGCKAGKTSFDLRDLSPGGFKLDGCRRWLDVSARMCAGASLALSHRQADGLRCRFWSMRKGIKEADPCPLQPRFNCSSIFQHHQQAARADQPARRWHGSIQSVEPQRHDAASW
jgi:hypothetical protein